MVHFGHRLCPTPKAARGLCRGERKVGLPTLQNLKGILGCPNLVSHLGDQAEAEVGGSRLPQWQGAPGRVFDGVQLPTKKSDTRNRLVEGGYLQNGVGGQREKIPICTYTMICSHRHRISSGRGLDLPPHGQDLEDREFHPSVTDCQSDNGLLLAIPARSAKFSSRCHSTQQIAFKASANIFVGTLGTNIKRLKSTHSREARSLTQSPGVVAEPVLHVGGNVSGSSRPTNSSFHRRIHYRLGRPSRNSVHNGNLDSPRSQVSHQSSGIAGSEICSARISDLTAEKNQFY